MNYPTFADKYGAASPPQTPAPMGAAGAPPAQQPPQNPWSNQYQQRLDAWVPDMQNAQIAMNPGAKV